MKYSKKEKGIWIEDWKRSGKSVWAYAKENGLIPQTFARWIKLESERKSGFVEIPSELKPIQAHEIRIEKGDIKIYIPLSIWIECPGAIMEGFKTRP